MTLKVLTVDIARVRSTILAFDPTLVASEDGYVVGKKQKRAVSLQYALYLLNDAEHNSEADRDSAIASLGMAVGLVIAHGIMIEEDVQTDPLLLQPAANTLPA